MVSGRCVIREAQRSRWRSDYQCIEPERLSVRRGAGLTAMLLRALGSYPFRRGNYGTT